MRRFLLFTQYHLDDVPVSDCFVSSYAAFDDAVQEGRDSDADYFTIFDVERDDGWYYYADTDAYVKRTAPSIPGYVPSGGWEYD